MQIEHLAGEAEFKFADAEATSRGEFLGYASTFGNVDLGGDIVERGAFAKTLASRKLKDVKMFFNHDARGVPIGKWLEMREDDRGLVARGQLTLDIPRARDVHAALKDGTLDGMSIGYRVPRDGFEFDRGGKVRRIKEIDLLEVSIVGMPMNPRAAISQVKSLSEMTIREIEEGLVRGTLPPLCAKEAKALLAGGFKAIGLERDAGCSIEEMAEAIRRNISTIQKG